MAFLYIQVCSILSYDVAEERAWRGLLESYPGIVDKKDVRNYPVAMRLLRSLYPHPELPEGYALYGADTTWVRVREMDGVRLVAEMQDKGLSVLYLNPRGIETPVQSTPHHNPNGPRLVSLHTKDGGEGYTDTAYFTRTQASFERGSPAGNTVTYSVRGCAIHDLLSAMAVYKVSKDIGMGFRLSTQRYSESAPLHKKYSKEEYQEYFRRRPFLYYKDYCPLEWLEGPDSLFHEFKTLVGASCVDHHHPATTFLDVVGCRRIVLPRDYARDHELWPLLHHMVSDFRVPFSWEDENEAWTLPLLRVEDSRGIDLDLGLGRGVQLCVETATRNTVLSYCPRLLSEEASSEQEGDIRLCIRDDYVLSEPFLVWQRRLQDLLVHLWNRREGWSRVVLDATDTASAAPPLDRLIRLCEESETKFYLENRGAPSGSPVFHYPLLQRYSSCSEKQEEVFFFPRLNFIDSEVFYGPLTALDGVFDARNNLGFGKTWKTGRIQEFEYNPLYEGDLLGAHNFYREGRLEALGPKSWSHVACDVPLFSPKNTMPIYCVNLSRRKDRREKMQKTVGNARVCFVEAVDGQTLEPTKENLNFFLGNVAGHRPGMMGCAFSHLKIWEALTKDDHHSYYIVLEDDVEVSSEAPFVRNDLEANLHTVVKTLDDVPLWDILFLGYSRWNDQEPRTAPRLVIEPLSSNYIGGAFGYILHKKAAVFMTTVVREFGMHVPFDNLWFKYYTEKRFLKLFQLSADLVRTKWCRPDASNTHTDTDVQLSSDVMRFHRDEDFERVENAFLPAHRREHKRWRVNDFFGVVHHVEDYSAFDSEGFLYKKGWEKKDLGQKDGCTLYVLKEETVL
jgi:GR25 family glycosyltransferase involved in LPS biosynthesis